jgi:hypothetical protein
LMSEGDKPSTRFASLLTLGSIGRGSSDTSFLSRSSRIRRPRFGYTAYRSQGSDAYDARFVEVSSIMSSIAASYSRQ